MKKKTQNKLNPNKTKPPKQQQKNPATLQEFTFISSLLCLLSSHFSAGVGVSAVGIGRVSLASLQIRVRFRCVLFVFHLPWRNSYPKKHTLLKEKARHAKK